MRSTFGVLYSAINLNSQQMFYVQAVVDLSQSWNVSYMVAELETDLTWTQCLIIKKMCIPLDVTSMNDGVRFAVQFFHAVDFIASNLRICEIIELMRSWIFRSSPMQIFSIGKDRARLGDIHISPLSLQHKNSCPKCELFQCILTLLVSLTTTRYLNRYKSWQQ